MNTLQEKNKLFFKEFNETPIENKENRNKIQISKKIHGIESTEKNGFIFEKGELFQTAAQNFLFSIARFTGSYHFSETTERKVFEAGKNGDFIIHLFKTPTHSALALAIMQNDNLFHFESIGSRKNHNELIDFVKKQISNEIVNS